MEPQSRVTYLEGTAVRVVRGVPRIEGPFVRIERRDGYVLIPIERVIAVTVAAEEVVG